MEKGRNNAILLTVVGIATLLVTIAGATFAFFTARINGANSTQTVTIQSADAGTLTFVGGNSITVQNIYPRGYLSGNGSTEMSTSSAQGVAGADTASMVWATKGFHITYTNQSANPYQYTLNLKYTNGFGTDQLHYVFKQVDGYCTDNKIVSSSACTTPNSWTANTNDSGAISAQAGWLAKSSTETSELLGTGTFAALSGNTPTEVTHTYVLTISYPDSGENQNYTGQTDDTNQQKTFTGYIEVSLPKA